MQLYYCRCDGGNVGDDLNPWLWPKLIPRLIDNDPTHLCIGIGSILNDRIPAAKHYTVLTSGVAGVPPSRARGTWDIVALRGPLSKRKMQTTKRFPLLDGAYLAPKLLPALDRGTACNVGYIPHWKSIEIGQWEQVCERAEVQLIDPRQSVETFIRELIGCDRVACEAMHGAILADAYGIPWTPVKAYCHTTEFKWRDWGGSLELKFDFRELPKIWRGETHLRTKRRIINDVKRGLHRIGIHPRSWSREFGQRKPSCEQHICDASKELRKVIDSTVFQVSAVDQRNSATELLMEKVQDHFTGGYPG